VKFNNGVFSNAVCREKKTVFGAKIRQKCEKNVKNIVLGRFFFCREGAKSAKIKEKRLKIKNER
jgi:hypothetical protein